MRNRKLHVLLVAGALLTGCAELDVTNPNAQSSDSFWRTSADANRGLIAAYNALLLNGTFARWQAFANDIRSDIGTARTSPWGDLANFNAFKLNDYNFEVNREIWAHNYELVGRANQVIANVPGIDMDSAERTDIVAQAKFLRGLAYFNLVTLYDNVPLITRPLAPEERPGAAPPAQTWAQIELDFSDAAAALPEDWGAGGAGRATKGAALGMLGKARLQQRKWAQAEAAFAQVIALNRYTLLANYGDNFIESTDNSNSESLFEVNNEDRWPVVTGLSFPKMIGPCYRPGAPNPEFNPTYCDGRPTRWYLDQFVLSRTSTNGLDPRLDATLLYSRADSANQQIYGRNRSSFFVDDPNSPQREDTMIFFVKYGEFRTRTDQRWDNPVNYKVLRFADILLMMAEAKNEQSDAAAAGFVNTVRARVSKSNLGALSVAQLRDTIMFERMFEFGLESSRWNDLRRQDQLTLANLPTFKARDPDFNNFEVGKSERLPIPTTERNLNPNVPQNPGW